VAWCINQIELIDFTILSLIGQTNGLRFNRYAALTLKVELVEELRLHLTSLERSCRLKDSIGEGGFTVIDMSDDTEVSNFISWRHD
jgi:hypothetical protein